MLTKNTLCTIAMNTFVMAIAFHLVADTINADSITAVNLNNPNVVKYLRIVSSAFACLTVILVLICSFMSGPITGSQFLDNNPDNKLPATFKSINNILLNTLLLGAVLIIRKYTLLLLKNVIQYSIISCFSRIYSFLYNFVIKHSL